MKILFVINHLKAGGAENVLTLLANNFQSRGYEVYIVKFTKEKSFFPLNKNIKIINLYNVDTKSSFIEKIIAMQRIFKEVSPDIIIAFTTTINIYSIIAAKLANIPIIVSEHTNYNRAKNNFWKYMRRIFYPFANKTILLTKYDEKKYAYLNNKVVIHNPLILKNKHINIHREKIILAVGRLHKVKGFDLLIEAFSKLKDKTWKLQILGEGPERKNLEQQINDINLINRISLLGVKKDVELYYKKASIFVLSSRAEGFPGALCEAMGYGCPSIAFDCISGPNEIITHGKDGLLIPHESVEGLKTAMNKLIEDKRLRALFAKESLKIKDKLNIEYISSLWLNEIEGLKCI